MANRQGIQLEFPFSDIVKTEMSMLPGGLVGRVYQVDGRWHAELGGGWWVFVAVKKQAAIDGVTRIYEQECQRMDNG